MVELKYVKKRKFKKRVAILTSLSGCVISVLSIVSFLGKSLGTFTVSLKNQNVSLTMSRTSDFEETSTYLKVENLEHFDVMCYQNFYSVYPLADVDSESTSYQDFGIRNEEGEITSVPFFKYTFFVKNIGTSNAKFTMSVKIYESTPDPTTKKTLEDILRVMVLEDGKYDDRVWALRSQNATHFDPRDGEEPHELTDLEYVCVAPKATDTAETVNKYARLAQPFLYKDHICDIQKDLIKPEEYSRYTIVFWLEGDDDETRDPQPKEAQLKLGVEIKAYES